jgi:beta-lactamase class D
MNPVLLVLLLAWCIFGGAVTAATEDWTERPEWGALFRDRGVVGTIAVADERTGSRWVFDHARAGTRFLPASTFKLPHTLFALEAGLVRDEFDTLAWDGVRHEREAWNQDQNLRSALRGSVVWVYQRLAVQLGEEREREYLQRIGYGNADPSGGVDHFWLDGPLRISAYEQVAFLQRLYRNELPFRVEHQRLVKDLMIVEANRPWILRAKTGWSTAEPPVGWWVGWVEWPAGSVFFALNLEMRGGADDLPKREAIARAVLATLDALPVGR